MTKIHSSQNVYVLNGKCKITAPLHAHWQITITFYINVIFEELKDHATYNDIDWVFNYS